MDWTVPPGGNPGAIAGAAIGWLQVLPDLLPIGGAFSLDMPDFMVYIIQNIFYTHNKAHFNDIITKEDMRNGKGN